jgi:hypothetical protein
VDLGCTSLNGETALVHRVLSDSETFHGFEAEHDADRCVGEVNQAKEYLPKKLCEPHPSDISVLRSWQLKTGHSRSTDCLKSGWATLFPGDGLSSFQGCCGLLGASGDLLTPYKIVEQDGNLHSDIAERPS